MKLAIAILLVFVLTAPRGSEASCLLNFINAARGLRFNITPFLSRLTCGAGSTCNGIANAYSADRGVGCSTSCGWVCEFLIEMTKIIELQNYAADHSLHLLLLVYLDCPNVLEKLHHVELHSSKVATVVSVMCSTMPQELALIHQLAVEVLESTNTRTQNFRMGAFVNDFIRWEMFYCWQKKTLL